MTDYSKLKEMLQPHLEEFERSIRSEERAAIAEKVEGLKYLHKAKPTASVYGYNAALGDILALLRKPESHYERFARHTDEAAKRLWKEREEWVLKPDASQGCCDKSCPFFLGSGNWGGSPEFWEAARERHERHSQGSKTNKE